MGNGKTAWVSGIMMATTMCGCGRKEIASSSRSELHGIWARPCTTDSGGPNVTSLSVNGATLIVSRKAYSDSSCASLETTTMISRSLEIREALTAPTGAKKLDATLITYTITPADSAVAASLNSQNGGNGACGSTQWAAGMAQIILGKDCGSGPVASGDVDYGIFRIDAGTTPNTLYLGDSATGDGTSEALRPTALEAAGYARQ